MVEAIVNKPEISKGILYTYVGLAIGIAILTTFIAYLLIPTPINIAVKLLVIAILIAVEIIMLVIIRSILKLEYILTENTLIIKISKLVGGTKEINIKNIKNVRRTLIPFGMRLLGASFHGGCYYIPGLGKAFMAITNFKDGIIIETEKEEYIITPSKPENFMEEIKGMLRAKV